MKVLIVSHNCFSETQNMGKTFSALFKSFEPECLMQLYLYPSTPDSTICRDYYRITDHDVLDSVIFRKKCGSEIEPQKNKEYKIFDNEKTAASYKKINRNSELNKRLRDVLWKFGAWKSDGLINWLQKGKPDIVFFAIGDAIFSQSIATWISQYLDIPLVTYVCDNFFYLKGFSKKDKILHSIMMRSFEKVIRRSQHLVSICPEMGEDYKKRFGTDYSTILTGSSLPINEGRIIEIQSKEIAFIGNTSLNRWKSLIEIQQTINVINKKYNDSWKLVYYGSENCNLKDVVEYGGYLSRDAVAEKMKTVRLLLHVESFDESTFERVKYSVSTKIADSISYGNCLLAYAPEKFASIAHLKRNQAAFIVTEHSRLESILYDALYCDNKRKQIIINARICAKHFHDAVIESEKLKTILNDVITYYKS